MHPVLQALTPAQEVYLDRKSYPHWPDLWAISGILCSPGSPEAAGVQPAAAAGSSGSSASPLPQFSAFDMLQTPLLAHGAGLQFKRAPHCVW